MWKMPGGIPANGTQVLIDLMGYIGAILSSEKRYQDSARDLLLDCTEAQVCIAHSLPAVVLGRPVPWLPVADAHRGARRFSVRFRWRDGNGIQERVLPVRRGETNV
ncbi:hypothetical protein ACNPQM_30515 [Streptomyces sp. NPDC056231]|uniref:hypothetical protein n=1 Tax=Streptomyces sp. NPDC056231 TaxID=3345755 RepID=UPI003AAADBE7